MNSKGISQIRKSLAGATGRHLERVQAIEQAPPLTLPSASRQKKAANLLAAQLRGTPFMSQFSELLVRDEADRAAGLKKIKATAIMRSRSNLTVLASQAARRVQDLERLTALPALERGPKYHLLNKPLFILPSRTIALDESEVIPAKSFAKFQGRTEQGLRGDVQFWYLWNNPNDRFAVINVDGYLIVHGHGYVGTGGGIFPGARSAGLTIRGRLTILEWENQPPTQPISQPDQVVEALSLSVSATGFGEVGAIEARDVFRGYDLRHTLLVVPPLATLIFTVGAEVSASCGSDSGLVEFDFSSGGFQVGSPAVLVTILS